MRRWTLLLAGAALWLFLAAIPALADGGPHVAATNSGVGASGLTADNCAGCHRAHTAQGAMLLITGRRSALCLTCHGAGATGATTNVMNGVQYYPVGASDPSHRVNDTTILGALRNGGFITARDRVQQRRPARIPVRVQRSSDREGAGCRRCRREHRPDPGRDVLAPRSRRRRWRRRLRLHVGQHRRDPRGDVQRDGQPRRDGRQHELWHAATTPTGTTPTASSTRSRPSVAGTGFAAATTGVPVTDAALPPVDRHAQLHRHPDHQRHRHAPREPGPPHTPTRPATTLHRRVPWNGTAAGTSSNDAPNGLSATFNGQINNWCSQCH